MRTLSTLTAGALALALVAPAIAAPGGAHAGHDRAQPLARAEMLAKVEQRFARLDTDRDGTISAAEMAAHREARKAARAERLAAMSAEDKARFEARKEARRAAMQERKAARLAAGEPRKKGGWLARVDANGDGAVTRDEFAARALLRFDRMDADKNGTVTPEERKASRRAARG
ncbi:EF-hand domain-containing protein [Erythrobacter neustonensis]|uniref:EF-hand domain-containing protein n=1 Tax=Erythrobacter neustonensis TaxID=1112 RepID=UPI000A77BB6F|nr:EF-hand domain-containing protein [Erythrobacter neustonensis]